MNIYIIGMRAVGKSLIGRLLAGKLDRPFIDMDRELVTEFRQSISNFVSASGWQAFRKREEKLLRRITQLKKHVVATGGGLITVDRNITLMRRNGWVVWLKADSNTLVKRLTQDDQSADMRPPIGEKSDAALELETVMQDRRHAYRRAMHVAVDTDGRDPELICDDIIDHFAAMPASKLTKG